MSESDPQDNFSTPPPIRITHDEKYSEKNDPPLVDLKVTNPVTYFKKWFGKILKNEGIKIGFSFTLKPLTAIFLVTVLGGGGFSIGSFIFPHSSPIFHREVMYRGNLQKTDKGIFLTLPNSEIYTIKPKSNVNLQNISASQVLVKGNLTRENYVIEATDILPLSTDDKPTPSPTSSGSRSSAEPSEVVTNFPKLYSDLSWEVTQSKILTFTSGKRRIEQEGIYLESSLFQDFSGEATNLFIDYYTKQLTTLGFKQTLNSSDPNGTAITYSKDDVYLTFGVKNVFQGSAPIKSGSGDNKKPTGYKAYIEHN